jgi:hypothetical protein
VSVFTIYNGNVGPPRAYANDFLTTVRRDALDLSQWRAGEHHWAGSGLRVRVGRTSGWYESPFGRTPTPSLVCRLLYLVL